MGSMSTYEEMSYPKSANNFRFTQIQTDGKIMGDVPKKRSDLPWETCRLGRARMFQHQDSPVAIHIRSDLYQF